ncbi:MAG: TIGR02253 family HAD-type hydrolase [Candidatus Hydrothermales bacterium]
MIKACIFDLDNTLLDFMRMKRESVEMAVEAMIDAGLKIKKEYAIEKIFKLYGETHIEDQKIFDRFLEIELGNIDYKILAAGIVAYRKAKTANMILYPHIKFVLTELLRMGLKLGVISDAPRLQAWTRLAEVGLHTIFDAVITWDDTGIRKPNPEPFVAILKKLDVKPHNALMVGDWAERDIYGAKEVGMITVFARYGDTFGTKNSGADFEIDDPLELIEIVKKLNENQGT